MKKLVALILAAMMLFSLAACGGGSTETTPAPGKNADRVLNLSILAPLTSFDDGHTANLQDQFVLFQTNDFLYWVNQSTLKIEPRIAESWEWNEAGTELTLHIRQGVKFHNGETVTVDDVVFSLDRARTGDKHKTRFAGVEKVEKVDDKTAKITLKAADAGFIVATYNHCGIVNKKEVEAAGENFGTKPHTAGCGPYKWGKVESMDSYWELEAFDDYYLGAPSIKKVTYTPIAQAAAGLIKFEAGELDWYIAPMANWDDLKANDKYNTELVAANHQSYLTMNYTNGELQDINLRKAIAYAIDKDACNDVAYQGLAKIAYYMYDPDLNIAAPKHDTTYTLNLEKAKEYLAKSSMPNGGKLSGALQCSAGGYFEKIANVVQQNLAAIGLEIEVTPMQSATNMEMMREGNYFMGISGGNPAGDYSGNTWYFSNTAYAKFDDEHDPNDEFDWAWMLEMREKGGSAKTLEERTKFYAELDAYVMDRAVYIPIFHKVQPYVWTKDLNIPVNYQDFYILREWSWK